MTKIRVANREVGNPFIYILSIARVSNSLPRDNGRCP